MIIYIRFSLSISFGSLDLSFLFRPSSSLPISCLSVFVFVSFSFFTCYCVTPFLSVSLVSLFLFVSLCLPLPVSIDFRFAIYLSMSLLSLSLSLSPSACLGVSMFTLFFSWVMICSLQNRNWMVGHSGDWYDYLYPLLSVYLLWLS